LTNSVFSCTITSAASVFASHSLSSRCNLLDYCACENRICFQSIIEFPLRLFLNFQRARGDWCYRFDLNFNSIA
jgi:hypothetical protein